VNAKYEQFIGIYEDAFTKEYCDSVIQYFEAMKDAGYALHRQQQDQVSKLLKDDLMMFPMENEMLSLQSSGGLQRQFNETFWRVCYPAYMNEFSILKEFGQHNSYSFKIQKTEVGQGYHMWHCESNSKNVCQRILAWTLYLNDVEDGGETEFLYQHMRVKPKAGTLVIWPAGFTHTHRGNPPLSGTKYIVTGWVEF
jgi:hypothetical protein